MLMATAALLADNRKLSEADIRGKITNVCRCGTYYRAALYPGPLEYVPLSAGGKVTEVGVAGRMLRTGFGDHVARSPISSHRKGPGASPRPLRRRIAVAGARRPGECRIAAASGYPCDRRCGHRRAMPKSACAANAQARVSAEAEYAEGWFHTITADVFG